MTQEEKKVIEELSVSQGYLTSWYISSVDANPPIWTDGHIEELFKDFYLIPKSEIEPPAMLSEEYLINLGFEAEGYPDEREYHLGVIKLIKLIGNDFYIADLFGQEVEFRYVYELQNLLSLCKDILT